MAVFFKVNKLIGAFTFFIGLELTFNSPDITLFKVIGILFIILGIYRIFSSGKYDKASEEKQTEKDSLKEGQNIIYALKWLDKNKHTIFNNVALKYKDEIQNFEYIVVSHKGVFNIISKDFEDKIIIDTEGNWKKETKGGTIGISSPLLEVNIKHKMLQSIFNLDYPIIDVVVLTNENSIIEGTKNSPLNIVKLDSILYFIESYNTEINISDIEIHKLEQNIKDKVSNDDSALTEPGNSSILKGNFSYFYGNIMNLKLELVLLIIPILFFVGVQYGVKSYFNSYKQKVELGSYTNNDKGVLSETKHQTFKINNCSTEIMKDKVKIVLNSIEISDKNTILHLTIYNNSKNDLQVFGTNTKLIDSNKKSYPLRLLGSSNMFDPIAAGSTVDCSFAFDAIPPSSKAITFSGEIWTLNSGVEDENFDLKINY